MNSAFSPIFSLPGLRSSTFQTAPRASAPQDAGDASFIDFWSWILFGGVLAGSYFKLNPILLIVLSAAAGIAIYL